MKIHFILLALIVLVTVGPATRLAAQEAGMISDQPYIVTTEFGLGYSRYLTDLEFDDLDKNGFGGMARVMWNPEHLLSIGLETGYQYLYSIDAKNVSTEFGTSDFSASMTSVPIHIAIAMRINDCLKLRGGTGIYLLSNHGDAFGDALESSLISIGMQVGLSYARPVSKDISLGAELKYSYITKLQDQHIAIQFLFIYDLIEY